MKDGDYLSEEEFMRRYEAMPHVKKAELIEGKVYMGSPVCVSRHAEPDNLIQCWLGNYTIANPRFRAAANGTVFLGHLVIVQPDAMLRLMPEHGGQSRLETDDYLHGAPEFAVEVANSTSIKDAGVKKESYRRLGIKEYLLWRIRKKTVDWWSLEDEEYQPLSIDETGVIRSRICPGLWLDVPALLAFDGARMMKTLRRGLKQNRPPS